MLKKLLLSIICLTFFFPLSSSAQECHSGVVCPATETSIFKGVKSLFDTGVTYECHYFVKNSNQPVLKEDKTPFTTEGECAATLSNFPRGVNAENVLLKTIIKINWISVGIRTIYNAAIAFAVVFCVVILMWAGILWISAAGNQSIISKAKGYISNALLGLILLLGSYLILYTLNPETTALRSIPVERIETIDFSFDPNFESYGTKDRTRSVNVGIEAIQQGLPLNNLNPPTLMHEDIAKQIYERNNQLLALGHGTSCQDGYHDSCTQMPNTDRANWSPGMQCNYNRTESRERFCRIPNQEGNIPIGRICAVTRNCYNPGAELGHYLFNINDSKAASGVCCAKMEQRTTGGHNHAIRRCTFAHKVNGTWRAVEGNEECNYNEIGFLP